MVPLLSPGTTHSSGPCDHQQVAPPGDAVTRYASTVSAPTAGAVQVTLTLLSADTPTTAVGAAGTFTGFTSAPAAEAADEPFAFFATTVIVYAVPSVSPVIVHEKPVVVQVLPPGLAVAVYPVT